MGVTSRSPRVCVHRRRRPPPTLAPPPPPPPPPHPMRWFGKFAAVLAFSYLPTYQVLNTGRPRKSYLLLYLLFATSGIELRSSGKKRRWRSAPWSPSLVCYLPSLPSEARNIGNRMIRKDAAEPIWLIYKPHDAPVSEDGRATCALKYSYRAPCPPAAAPAPAARSARRARRRSPARSAA